MHMYPSMIDLGIYKNLVPFDMFKLHLIDGMMVSVDKKMLKC